MSNDKTHVFTLPSGPECEVKQLIGKHQRWLTEQSDSVYDGLTRILADVVVRIGSAQGPFSETEVKEWLSADRKKMLVELRQFSLSFDPVFRFEYTYTDVDTNRKEVLELTEDLSQGFPTTPFKQQYTELSEVLANKDVEIELPDSGKKVKFRLLDGKGEEVARTARRKDRSSHTTLLMRNPREMTKTDSGMTPIQLNLDNISLRDIEALRKAIYEHEGRVDTEISFEHPNAHRMAPKERNVIIDLTAELSFFFPSGRI